MALTVEASASEPRQTTMRSAVGAAVIGNALEWYDFVVYSYLASVIAKNFFPATDEVAALLATFAAFGIGFIARPFGAIAIGWIGDRHGRRAALVLTLLLMALGTVLIGLVPSYASIGVLAPAVLVVARLLQGFSVGGEWGNATAFIAEWAPRGRRGYYSSWQQASVVAGLLLGSGIAALLNTLLAPAAMEEWGWRIPFLLGGFIAPVGIYMRWLVDESPAYRNKRSRLIETSSTGSRILQTVQAFGFMAVSAVQFYIFLAYMPTFVQRHGGLSHGEALWSNSAGLLLLMIATPMLGAWSDRVGRKPLMIASCLFFILAAYPIFAVMQGGVSLAAVVMIQLLTALAIALYCGALPAAIAEIFETPTRTAQLSIANGTAVAIFGGFAPFIATWLIARTGSPVSPTYYVIAAAVISLIAVLSVKETAHRELA
jgi:MHS family proline/betaine transporter-like MFS transporter